jgi:phytoene synthase
VTEIEDLYRRAAIETATGSKSFFFATRFFPKQMASAAYAVYWFCRYTDDLVDECSNAEQGRKDLEAWTAALRSAVTSKTPTHHPVLQVFLDTVSKYEIPLEYAFELIEGMRMDLNQTTYRTFDELRLFCYRVASVVGLMMCHVIGFEHPSGRDLALPHAIDLGIAMQLTNIMRDIGEDLERGRIYLPQDEMQRFGYSETDLRHHLRNDAFAKLMNLQAERAHAFYEKGNAGIQMLNRDGRFAVKIASDVYREILQQLETSGFDVFDHRAVVPASRKYWLTASNLAGPLVRHTADLFAFWRKV